MEIQFESLFGENAGYVAELLSLYRIDPSLVGPEWTDAFSRHGLISPTNGHATNGVVKKDAQKSEELTSDVNSRSTPSLPETSGPPLVFSDAGIQNYVELAQRVTRYLLGKRNFGHFTALVNPLIIGILPVPSRCTLQREHFDFSESDLNTPVPCDGFAAGTRRPVREILDSIDAVYGGSVGFEYWHISQDEERFWLRDRIESGSWRTGVDKETRQYRLQSLIHAEQFEAGLHRKYVGAKRFSCEGSETLLPMLLTLVNSAAEQGIAEVVLGMAHRGRLNVLANVCGRSLGEIFTEFEDATAATSVGAGDVKYHLGFGGEIRTREGKVLPIRLASNPSHLEFVTPVIMGIARALQDERYNEQRLAVLPVALHGDAAFCGQGVVTETLNFAQVRGYHCGGAVHLVINNQLGFTTSPDESRSSVYCTDFAKAMDIPVFHVNSEDIDGACAIMDLALEYRQKFRKDVVIDLVCYRKYGHNEGDDPTYTQPLLYSGIRAKQPLSVQYSAALLAAGDIDSAFVEGEIKSYVTHFDSTHRETVGKGTGGACALRGRLGRSGGETSVSLEVIDAVASALESYPKDFHPHPKLERLFRKRIDSMRDGKGVEWALAEALALGSLLLNDIPVRFVGQDVIRGTFSHRHLGLDHYVVDAGEPSHLQFFPLNELQRGKDVVGEPRPALCELYNTTLSEMGVLGFEYGYSVAAPDRLVMWEAQFGDFSNGAQVIIDQFLCSSESKWNEFSGLVLLLPHGYEGLGPEHTSARLERFLQLCAEGNMTVAYPTTSAQYFHMIRRHALAEVKRPLIVMTPKGLLRAVEVMSGLEEFVRGRFNEVIYTKVGDDPKVLFMCTGKVYFDVLHGITEASGASAHLLRLEQLYPFPGAELIERLSLLKPAKVVWVQEEPENMGAWRHVETKLRDLGISDCIHLGRPEGSSTATGSPKFHHKEQKAIVDAVLVEIRSH